MATRLSTSLLLATLAFVAYTLARESLPQVYALLRAAAAHAQISAPISASVAESLTLPAGPSAVIAFIVALCASYLAQPGRIQRMAESSIQRSVVHAAFIVGPAIALWLALLYLSGQLLLIGRLFPLWLAVVTGALLLPLVYLRPRAPLEAVGVALAAILVWTMSPPGAERSVALVVYLVVLALAYAGVARQIGTPTSLLGRATTFFAIVVGAHLAWVVCFFLAGRPQALSVGLVFAAAAVMYAVGGLLPLAVAYLRNRGELSAILYDPVRRQDPTLWPKLIAPTASSGGFKTKRAWIISYTGVSNEPRVLRQCEALLAEGWEVVVCGFDGHSPRPPQWTFVRLPSSEPFTAQTHRFLALVRRLGHQLLIRFGITPAAHLVHGTTPLWLHTRLQLAQLAREHPELRADLVVSHDWHSADAGYAVASVYGAKFSVDVHEYAAGQYSYDPEWVRLHRPVTVAVQGHYLRRADVVTVVCQGIGELIAKENGLAQQPVVIRSVPFKTVQPFRPTGKKIEVLYHGDLSQRREIHTAIASLPLWRPEFYLRLRGSGDAPYLNRLRAQIAELGLEKRVIFEPPVPFDQIVPAANRADIGFFSFDGTSPQIRFTLPNKLFEYIMAGLCLCVGDTPEVNRIVSQYGNGELIATHSAEAIAAAINSLDRETIDARKKASIAAAEDLNWPAEKERLLQAYREIL